ncbi:MAG: ChbG/HpnK family deacetylase [Patescibacteria group bacterium]|nr:ChbG/HpnK family deacetylase [Patescibacteria group bacterium]
MKYLIINADDFGYSKVFNTSILTLIKKGFITSTTAMVNRIDGGQADQIDEILALTKSRNLSIGLHLELSNVNFRYEVKIQHAKFISIFGFKPSHIDLHKFAFLDEAYPVIMEFCKANNLACRNHNIDFDGVIKTHNQVLNGTGMNFDELKRATKNFKDGESYEIFFHPGSYDPDCKSSLNKKRELDVEKIEAINPFLKGNNIKLISYKDLFEMH